MTDLARAHNHIDANVIASPHCRVGVINRSCNRPNFSRRAFRQRKIRFFTNRESRREFGLPHFASRRREAKWGRPNSRSEEHTSELQSPDHLVCRLLLEKKKKNKLANTSYYCP